MKLKYIFLSLVCSSFVLANEVSFLDAWKKVVEKSDTLKAKKEDLLSAKFRQEAAKDLDFPELNVSATFTHLDRPVKLSGASLSKNSKSMESIVGGIVKGSSSAVYSKALSSGATPTQAMQMAKKNADDILLAVSDLQNKSFTLKKQNSVQSDLKALWPIYTGGKIEAAQIVAKGDIDEAFALLELSKLEQFENLAKVYFSVVLLKDVYQTKKEAVKTFEKHYNQALKLEKYGQIAKIERLSAQVNYDKAKIEANKTQKKLEIAKIALSEMLHEEKVEPSTKLFINKNIEDMELFKKKTIDSYPIFSLLKAKDKKTKGLILAKKSEYKPNVFLFGNYNIYREKTLTSDSNPDWYVGAGISYKLFDNKGRKGHLESSYRLKEKIRYIKKQSTRDISVLVEKTYKNALLALEEYDGLSSSISLGYENVRLHEKSFAQGLSTSMSVVDAELFLQSVKTQRAVASYNYVMSLTKLLALSNQIDKFKIYK